MGILMIPQGLNKKQTDSTQACRVAPFLKFPWSTAIFEETVKFPEQRRFAP
jgi:hypothetical protein